jgi:CubicO group peptidase (beta-lactamase class C family)
LQDPVQRYLPAFPYPAITIKQLLTHSSGLPDYLSLARHYWPNQQHRLSNQELIGQLSRHTPSLRFKPGSRFAYSNTGYAVLASLIESVSGVSYTGFIKTHVFQPLGMNSSSTLPLIDPSDHLAQGHTAARKRVHGDYLDTIFGDKGLYSSVEDLYLWDQALYAEKLLEQATLQEAFEGRVQVNHAEAYGYGWRVRQLACGERVLYHTGRWHGFRSYLMRNPRDRSTVIILSNVDKSIDLEDFQFILYPPAG